MTDWEERTYIEGAKVKVVGLIRGLRLAGRLMGEPGADDDRSVESSKHVKSYRLFGSIRAPNQPT